MYESYRNVTVGSYSGSEDGVYYRVKDKVELSPSVENYYCFAKGETTAFASCDFAAGDAANSYTVYLPSGSSLTVPAMFFVRFQDEQITGIDRDSGEEKQLPAGLYVDKHYLDVLNTVPFGMYGIASANTVTNPDGLYIMWVPPVVDDPVYKFLKDQSKSSVPAGTTIIRRSKTADKLYRIGYANRTTTQKDVEIPTLELVVHETKTGDVYALDKTATDIYKAYTNQYAVTLIGFDSVEYTLSSVVVNDPSISFTFAPVSGSHEALTFTASSSNPYPSRSGGGGK